MSISSFFRVYFLSALTLLTVFLASTGRIPGWFMLGGILLPTLLILQILFRPPALSRPSSAGVQADWGDLHNEEMPTFCAPQVLLQLSPADQTITGYITAGSWQQQPLTEIAPETLLAWLRSNQTDLESRNLILAWFELTHPEMLVGAGLSYHSQPAPTAREARQILAVSAGASDHEISHQHKRLVQQLHPDKGGCAWLFDRVNQARDRLL